MVSKINHTESKISDRKNLSLVETEPLAQEETKIRRCVGKMHGKSYREINFI